MAVVESQGTEATPARVEDEFGVPHLPKGIFAIRQVTAEVVVIGDGQICQVPQAHLPLSSVLQEGGLPQHSLPSLPAAFLLISSSIYFTSSDSPLLSAAPRACCGSGGPFGGLHGPIELQ